jgi:predicted nucleic acid-binding protein
LLIVVDASIMCDFLLDAERYPELVDFLIAQDLVAPSLIEYEIGHTLRRLNLLGKLTDERAKSTIEAFEMMPIALHFAAGLMSRTWELRQNITFYDASYVALAEALEAPLYTRDKKLATAPGHRAQIILM